MKLSGCVIMKRLRVMLVPAMLRTVHSRKIITALEDALNQAKGAVARPDGDS